MAIIVNNPSQVAWEKVFNSLGQVLGNLGTKYVMNKDVLDKINDNLVEEDVFNEIKNSLGEGIAKTVFIPTEEGKYKLDMNKLSQLIELDEYKNNALLKSLFDIGQARRKFAEKNIIGQILGISDPVVSTSLAITGSSLNKTKKKQQTQQKLKEILPKILNLSEEYDPIYDIIMQDKSLLPLIFLLNKSK